ncbi:MAG: protein kinase [Myxococcales bacterium]|nr:protein kinase [Myxococcales bacterium]
MPNPPKLDDASSQPGAKLGAKDSSPGSALDAREAAVLKQLAEVQDPYIGMLLNDRYKIIKKLGAGGMGAVYLAEHVMIERRVAIKILSQDFASKPDLVQRFIQEARAAARIGHENIVEVHDFGETASGSVFFTMEFLEGHDLAHVIAESGALTVQRIRLIMGQLCRALAAAHQKGIVHRDLKPENIYLVEKEGKSDFVKILDFGIAKMTTMESGGGGPGGRLTQSGMIFGTAEYMSPEQARGETPDHRVDIYALGCILYEMLTGRVPFHAETYMGTLTKHMFEAPEPPSRRSRNVPPDLEAICLRAMDKERTRRFQTMTEFAQAIDGELAVAPVMPAPPMADPSMSMRAGAFPPGVIPMGMGAPGYAPQMMMQPGPYGVPGQVQAPMGMHQSGMIGAPMAMNPSGMVNAPMAMSQSGMMSGPMVSGMHIQPGGYSQTAPPAYEVAPPPSSGQLRRLVFIFAGAAIGVAVLALLLLWPQNTVPINPLPPTTLPAVQRPKGPAKLTVRALPGSRVSIDFLDIGIVPGSGEVQHELTSATGAPEWSVSIHVTKNGFEEFVSRQTIRAGQNATIQASQSSLGGGPNRPSK